MIDLESYLIPLDEDDYALEMYASYEELVEEAYILESVALEFEHELAYMIATEAVNGEDSNISSKASSIASKFKSGFNKLKNGKKKNDQKMIKEGQDEVNEASDELKEAESEAFTPEEKKKLSTAAKVGITVGGAALVGLLTFLGIKNRDKIQALISKLKRDKGDSPSETAETLKTVVDAVSEATIEAEPVIDTPTASFTLTERQQKAQDIYDERRRKKELKDWAVFYPGQPYTSESEVELEKAREDGKNRAQTKFGYFTPSSKDSPRTIHKMREKNRKTIISVNQKTNPILKRLNEKEQQAADELDEFYTWSNSYNDQDSKYEQIENIRKNVVASIYARQKSKANYKN